MHRVYSVNWFSIRAELFTPSRRNNAMIINLQHSFWFQDFSPVDTYSHVCKRLNGSNVWYCSQESQIPARFLPGMFELPELPLPLRQGKQDTGTAPTWGSEHPKARSSCRMAQMCVRRKLISKLISQGSGWMWPDINPRKEQADLPWSCGLKSMLVLASQWVLPWPRLLVPRKPLGRSCPEPSASQGFQGNQESSQHRSSFRHHIFPWLNWQLFLNRSSSAHRRAENQHKRQMW